MQLVTKGALKDRLKEGERLGKRKIEGLILTQYGCHREDGHLEQGLLLVRIHPHPP